MSSSCVAKHRFASVFLHWILSKITRLLPTSPYSCIACYGCGTKQPILKRDETADFQNGTRVLLQPICMERDLFEEVHICCLARSFHSLRQEATLRHGHMARRFALAFRALGVCEHS